MKEINFVDYLTKKDVRTLLTLMGLRFINETDEEVPEESRASMIKRPITRMTDEEDGNYYTDDNTEVRPYLTWRATSNCLYSNWLNYYMYQATPYDLNVLDRLRKK